MSSAEAKNLEAISKAIDQHNQGCEWPAVAVVIPKLDFQGTDSLNTLRVCTLTDDKGDVHVLYSFVRTGRHGSFVDNTTSGGLNALICDDGVIRRPAMSDKTGMYFDMHPDTCTPFLNFRVPYFDEAVALCKKAAKVRPGSVSATDGPTRVKKSTPRRSSSVRMAWLIALRVRFSSSAAFEKL